MEFEPRAIAFRDVRLNQAYTTSLCLTNTYSASVEVSLIPPSSRYTINPNKIHLTAGQSIVVTVRLFLSHYPNFSKGSQSHEESITIKSSYFEHQVGVSFSLHSRDATTSSSSSRSLSPSLRSRVPTTNQPVRSNLNSQRSQQHNESTLNSQRSLQNMDSRGNEKDLEKQLAEQTKTVQQLESIITQLESKFPSVQEIVRNRIEQEQLGFEEKSEKVSFIAERFLFISEHIASTVFSPS
jgi:uncharacterized coiled-coil protein SlyX